jgi:hypothetical protein
MQMGCVSIGERYRSCCVLQIPLESYVGLERAQREAHELFVGFGSEVLAIETVVKVIPRFIQ